MQVLVTGAASGIGRGVSGNFLGRLPGISQITRG